MKVQIKITESRDNCSILTFFFLDEEDNEDEAERERETEED